MSYTAISFSFLEGSEVNDDANGFPSSKINEQIKILHNKERMMYAV
jgi:hypothetical protein